AFGAGSRLFCPVRRETANQPSGPLRRESAQFRTPPVQAGLGLGPLPCANFFAPGQRRAAEPPPSPVRHAAPYRGFPSRDSLTDATQHRGAAQRSKEPPMKLAWILWLSQVLPQPAAD